MPQMVVKEGEDTFLVDVVKSNEGVRFRAKRLSDGKRYVFAEIRNDGKLHLNATLPTDCGLTLDPVTGAIATELVTA